MDTLGAVGLVVLGLALRAGGGEALVRAATTLAELAGVTPAVIGLTVVAIGTSLPELVEGRGARGEDLVERGGWIERCFQLPLAAGTIVPGFAWAAAPLAPRLHSVLVLGSVGRDVGEA